MTRRGDSSSADMRYARPSPAEIVLGPSSAGVPVAVPAATGSARESLETEILASMSDGACFVSFSGGRDSSAVLAVAVRAARSAGLPDPRPITLRYPGDADSDETRWQEMVLEHLGIEDRIVIDITTPATYLDEVVRANLRSRGLVWPPALQLDDPVLDAARGGTLLTGEGGDEVLGTRRVTPLALLLKMRRRPNRRLLRWAGESLVPRRLNHGAVRRGLEGSPMWRWLTPRGREELVQRTASADDRPLHWGQETIDMISHRVPDLLRRNYQAVADEHDVTLAHPLLSPPFLAALAAEGGRWGYAGRTHLMRVLFSDLLPDELLSRSTKAHFGAVRWRDAEREFARAWDGSGLAADLVDVEALRAEWLSERPAGSSALALHAAWLHSEGLSLEGDER